MASGDSLWLNTKANKGEAVLIFPWVLGFRRCQGSEAVSSFGKHFFNSSFYIYKKICVTFSWGKLSNTHQQSLPLVQCYSSVLSGPRPALWQRRPQSVDYYYHITQYLMEKYRLSFLSTVCNLSFIVFPHFTKFWRWCCTSKCDTTAWQHIQAAAVRWITQERLRKMMDSQINVSAVVSPLLSAESNLEWFTILTRRKAFGLPVSDGAGSDVAIPCVHHLMEIHVTR